MPMPFAEDLSVYMADFGSLCVASGVAFRGVLDQPDDVLDFQRGSVHTRSYDLRYITAAVPLKKGDLLTVEGQAMEVRDAPRQLDDGAFSVVRLSKV